MHVKVKCPCCNSRVIDTDENTTVIVKVIENFNKCDFYVKCPKCKKEIGINKIK